MAIYLALKSQPIAQQRFHASLRRSGLGDRLCQLARGLAQRVVQGRHRRRHRLEPTCRVLAFPRGVCGEGPRERSAQ